MDAGIATDDNLKFLKENGYGWICISKKARVAPPDRAPDSTCGATLMVNMRDIEPRKEDDGYDGAFLSP